MSVNDALGPNGDKRVEARAGAKKKPSSAPLDPAINATIGRRLEAHYRALAEEPLPDRFIVLLAELEAKERKS
jgi:hypothetical protein